MNGPTQRTFAVAGVLALSLVFGGTAVAAPVWADPGSETSGQDSGNTGSTADTGSEPSGSGSVETDPAETDPAETDPDETGSGKTGSDETDPDETGGGVTDEEPDELPVRTPDDEERSDPVPVRSGGSTARIDGRYGPLAPGPQNSIYSNSIEIPWFRLPAAGEIAPGSWPSAANFYGTLVVPVPSLSEYLRALRVAILPAPPPPGPAFRTQQEAPVADAFSGTTGGGDGSGGAAVSEPVVVRAPLVTVPRSTTVAGRPTRIPTEVTASGAAPAITQPGVAGVRTPAIRGSVASTPGAAVPLQSGPAAGQSTRAGLFARGGAANATLAEIAAVALPGVAGLLFLTVGGGMIGYRQANSVRFIRTAGAERFLA